MQKLLAKKLNKKGFTLAELLIVVAIIAVLVAIAVPIFTGALEKARLGVHRSNARNLKSMAVATILADPEFEAHDSASAWKVIGSYNFSSQQFSISEISVLDSVTNPSMAASRNSNGDFKTFGKNDEDIGKIGTNGTVWYEAEIVANDFSGKVSWK